MPAAASVAALALTLLAAPAPAHATAVAEPVRAAQSTPEADPAVTARFAELVAAYDEWRRTVHPEYALRRGDETRADAVYAGTRPLCAEDVAECVLFAANRPAHVNIDTIVVMPTDQASPQMVHRAT